MMKKKTILIIVAAAVVILVGWQVYNKAFKSQAGPGGPRGAVPVPVEILAVRTSSIQDFGNFTGSLLPKSQFMVAPKIAGKLKKLNVNIGDRVVRGQLIALLDDEEYNQQFIQAEADLNVAQANLVEARSSLDVAQRELERVRQLHERGISADSELDAVKGAFTSQEARQKVAQAQVANKEAALKAAELRLSYTRILASWEGGGNVRVIGERFVDEGALLMPNAPILSILEINPLIAVIHISDKDYSRVKVGQKARIISDAVSGREASGQVERMAPLLQEASREARIEIEFPNPDEAFKPGMFVNVRIEFETHPDATVVPLSSVVKRNDREGIFLADLETKTARFVPVKLGIVSGDVAEIIDPSPLEGSVVSLGQHLLVEGSPIILSGPESGTGSEDAKPAPDKKSPTGGQR